MCHPLPPPLQVLAKVTLFSFYYAAVGGGAGAVLQLEPRVLERAVPPLVGVAVRGRVGHHNELSLRGILKIERRRRRRRLEVWMVSLPPEKLKYVKRGSNVGQIIFEILSA